MLTCGNPKEGFEYEGEFEKGKRHGFGILKTRMALYKGEFKDDFRHGHGE
jgi:hypothetical protein